MNRRTAGGILLILVAIGIGIFFALRLPVSSPETVSQPNINNDNKLIQSTEIPTQSVTGPKSITVYSTGWVFSRFNNNTTTFPGNPTVYYWGEFVNSDGVRIAALCLAPNSPSPEKGTAYIWDIKTNSLGPDSAVPNFANLQRFWYPYVVGN